MSLEHSPAKQQRRVSRVSPDQLNSNDLKVLTLREFAALNGFSFMTVKRLFKAGQGPVTIQLSPKRVGVRMIEARRWQEARLRSADLRSA